MEKFTSSVEQKTKSILSLKKLVLVLISFFCTSHSKAQTTIFSENVGTVSSTTSISSHTGWQNNGLFTFTGTGDVRNTTPSSGYSGSSGNANVFITGTVGLNFQISGINTTGFSNLTLTFGQWKSGAVGAANLLVVEVSSDGTNYTALTYSRTDGSTWALISPTGSIPSTSNLRIRFRNPATTQQFRIDDIRLTGVSGITSAQSGDWAATSTWVGGVVPSATDNVIIAAGHTVSTSVALTRTGSTTVNGTFQLNSGGFASGTNFTYGSSGGLNFNSSSAYGVDASHVYWPTTNGPVNVSVLQGGLTLNAGANRTVSGTFQTAAGVTFGSASLTFNGICRINTGGFFNNNPTYGSSSTLIYNTGSAFGRGNEWTTATSGAGYPANVQISNPGTVTTLNLGANFAQCSGTMTVDASTVLNTPSGGLVVLGNVINNGTLSLGGDVTTSGNWTVGASATQTNNNRAVFFNGASGTQTITRTGGGNIFFDYLVVNKAAGSVQLSASPATSITINTTSGEVLQLINAGAFDLNGQSLTLNNANGNILVNASGRSITSTIAGAVININGIKFVTGAGTLNLGSNITMILAAGMDFGPSRTTLNGTLQINGGGFVSTNAPIYSSVSTLLYNNVTGYGVGNEWNGNAATAGVGTPQNVTLTNSSVNMPANVARTLAGNLLIGAGSTMNLGTSPGGDLTVRGNFSNSGTFNANTRLVVFNGTVAQTLTGATTFDFLRLNNSAGLTLNNAIVVNTNLDLTSGRITLGSNNLSLGSAASISNASATNYIVTNGTGRLVKASVGSIAFTFPIGLNATNYTPVAITNTTGTSDLSVNVGSTITNAVFDATRIVNLQWSINSSAATTATVTPTWVAANQAVSFTNTGVGELGIYTTAYTTSPVTLSTTTTTAAGLAFQNGSNLIVVGNSNAIVCSTFIAPTITGQPTNTTLIAAATNNTASFSTSATGASAFQWQFSTTPGGTYTNVANNTPNGLSYTGNATATLNITSNSNTAGGIYYYRCVVTGTCGATSTTNVGALTVYCGSSSADDSFEFISNVTVAGGINQTSTNSFYTNYFATQTATVNQGQLLTVTITAGNTVASDAGYILADWNQDGDFADLGETSAAVTGAGPVYNATLTVPATATLGKTRLRVKFGDAGAGTAISSAPCQTFTYGEVEDYGLLVTVPVAPTITALSATSGCQGQTLTITGTDLNGVTASNVTIGGTPVASITSNTANQIVAVIGSGTTGVVQVTTAGGTASSLDTFTVNPVASATWASSAIAVCATGSAQTTTLAYTATSGAASTYSITWNATPTNSFAPVTNEPNTFNTGAGTITIQIPAGTAAGTYTGTITVSNAFGCPSSGAIFTLTVNPTPTATASNGGPYCEGSTIALTAGPSGMTSYAWTGPNGFSSNSTQQTVTQNFNGLGTVTTWTDNVTLPGWYLLQGQGTGTTTSPATAVTTLINGTGSSNTAGVHNLNNGVITTDRALGSFGGNSIAAIGSTAFFYGVRVTNTTGFTVTDVTVSYTGEQYRDANTNPHSLTVDYSTNATALTTASGTWTSIPALTYTSTTNTNSLQVDGNAAANRNANLTATLTGLSIPNGESIWIRWADLNDSGNDHGLAIDDVSVVLTANANPVIANATPAMSGVYTLTVTNAFGCTSTATTTVSVDAAPVAGTVSSNQTICNGDVPTDLTLAGFSGTIQKWQRADDLAFTTNVTDIANTTSTLTLGALTTTGYYRAVVGNGSCAAVNSNVVTITVNSIVTPTFTPVAPICQGAPLSALPTTSNNGITGSWTPALDNTQTTTYTFTPDAGQCASTATLTITVGGTTTWNGTAWSNGAPDALTTAVIAGNYTATANLDACSLVVNNNAAVVIPAGFNVHLSGALTVASGSTFTLNSNANLLQDDSSAVNSGNIIVRRTTNPLIRLDYVMWSSPVAAQNLLAFSPQTSVSPTIRFYTYNTTTNLFANVADFATHPMVLGRGYLIRLPFNHPTAPATWTGSFTGVPNNGTQNITMANVAPGQRYNLVGNPYPSTLSMTDFYNDNSNAIEPTVYFWRKTNGTQNPTYCTYNLSTDTYTDNGQPFTEDPNGVIQVGQGFIVEAKDAATTLTFNNGQRVANNANQTFRTAATAQSLERHRVWLNLTGTGGEFSQMMVGYFTDGTLGLDGTDSKYFNDGTTELTSPVNGVACIMNGRPVPFDAADVVPLTYKVATAGTFSVAIDRKDGLFASTTQPIYVHDLTTGTYHNLNDGPYTFTTAVGTFANRLELVYQNALSTENPTLNANSFTVVKNPTQVQVSATESIDTVRVYDLRGRLIVQQMNVNATQVSLPVVGNQVYLVQVTTTSGLTGVKKVL